MEKYSKALDQAKLRANVEAMHSFLNAVNKGK